MIIKQPTPILRKPRIILLFNGFTATAGCAMVACNGFAATGGTAVVDDAAVAEFVVAVFGVEVDVSATGVTAGAGAGDRIGGTTAADTGDSGGAAAGVGVGGSTGAPQA